MGSDMNDDKAVLAAVEAADPDFGRLAGQHPHKVVPLDAPFLQQTRLVRLDVLTPRKPLFAHYAITDGAARRVTGDPAAFDAAVAADPGEITDAGAALALVAARVEATRPAGTRRALVQGREALPWLPKPDEAAQAKKAEIEQKLGAAQPTVSASEEGGFVVEGWVLDGRDLVWTRFTVAADGAVTASEGDRLAALPFTYVR